jgi:ABC-type polysaccharide/polyol phosphate export permease
MGYRACRCKLGALRAARHRVASPRRLALWTRWVGVAIERPATGEHAISMMSDTAARSLADLATGARQYRVWSLLAWDDVIGRYRRTKLGPLWMTLSHAATIVGLALSFSIILNRPIDEYFVYLTAGMTVWVFIAATLNDAPNLFVRGHSLLTAYELPASIHIFRAILGHLLTFSHHMLIYGFALLFVKNVSNWNTLWAIPGLALISVAAAGWSTILGLLGARFRDIAPAVGSVTTMLFMVTPIFWERRNLQQHQWIAQYNPLYHFIELVREPLLGREIEWQHWVIAGGITVVLLIAATISFVLYRRRLTYWL